MLSLKIYLYKLSFSSLSGDSLLRKEKDDVWSSWVRQIWIDFIVQTDSVQNSKPKNVPFIDSLPVMAWLMKAGPECQNANKSEMNQSYSDPSIPQSNSCDGHCIRTSAVYSNVLDNSSGIIKSHSLGEPALSSISSNNNNVSPLEDDLSGRRLRNRNLLDFYRSSTNEGIQYTMHTAT